jgi:hypothetical protein
MDEYGFIIPTCIHSNIHLEQLNRCINSIAQFHPHSQIIIINDTPSTYQHIYNHQIEDLPETYKHILAISIVKSINPGSGELQTFKVLLETPDFTPDKAVIIQDAMVLLEPLPIQREHLQEPVKFLWYFTNHRLQWNTILEPLSKYNSRNYILTHTDLLIDCILTDFRDNLNFQKFAINRLRNMNEKSCLWVGCFGCCCVISKTALKKINDTVPFVDTFARYTLRRNRCGAESLFALICHFVFPEYDYSNSIDGLYYDGIKVNSYNGRADGSGNISWCARNKYIGKISFGR